MILYNLDTAPASEPVTTAEAKAQLDVTHSDDDDKIDLLISAARETVEGMVGKYLVSQTWTRTSPCASGRIKIEKAPLIAVTTLEYFDADNASQTLDVNDFFVYSDEDAAWIEPQPGVNWPQVYDRQDAFKITFTVGFPTVPPALKQAILLLVAHWYDHAHAASEKPMREVPLGVQDMVNIHRIGWAA